MPARLLGQNHQGRALQPEARSPSLGARGLEPEARSPSLGARALEPEACSPSPKAPKPEAWSPSHAAQALSPKPEPYSLSTFVSEDSPNVDGGDKLKILSPPGRKIVEFISR